MTTIVLNLLLLSTSPSPLYQWEVSFDLQKINVSVNDVQNV